MNRAGFKAWDYSEVSRQQNLMWTGVVLVVESADRRSRMLYIRFLNLLAYLSQVFLTPCIGRNTRPRFSR